MKPQSNSLLATGPAILLMKYMRSVGSVFRNWTAFTFSGEGGPLFLLGQLLAA